MKKCLHKNKAFNCFDPIVLRGGFAKGRYGQLTGDYIPPTVIEKASVKTICADCGEILKEVEIKHVNKKE